MLLYQATHVPVGEDQKQHLELARDIAQKFNNDFGGGTRPVFTLPDPIIPPEAARIMCLRDGSAKMSKSDPCDMSRINLADDADTIMQKVKKAKTDPEPLPSEAAGLAGRPEALNLVAIYAALSGETAPMRCLAEFGGQGFGAFKPALGELLVETLRADQRPLPRTAAATARRSTRSSPAAREGARTGPPDARCGLCRAGAGALTGTAAGITIASRPIQIRFTALTLHPAAEMTACASGWWASQKLRLCTHTEGFRTCPS